MIKYEDECCGCATESYPCMGETCPYRHVPHFYCDRCGLEEEEIYNFNGEGLCADCIIDSLEPVTAD